MMWKKLKKIFKSLFKKEEVLDPKELNLTEEQIQELKRRMEDLECTICLLYTSPSPRD